MATYSKRVAKIFEDIDKEVKNCYNIANKAKALGFDPNKSVKIPLAKNMLKE